MLPCSINYIKILGTKNLNRRLKLTELPEIRLTHSPPGSGAGKGGGQGGTVREAGGGLGRFGAAQEEGYFYNKTREELQKLKEKMKQEGDQASKQKKGGDDD